MNANNKFKIRLDEFCYRQFDDPNYSGTKIPIKKEDFVSQLNQYLNENFENIQLVEGYAPFCKHIFIPNFVKGVKVGNMKITESNEKFLKSGYLKRTEKELAVLSRWFPKELVEVPEAKYLDLILYSREQIKKENEAMGNPVSDEDFEWGLISIKGQLEDYETPMAPITMMRNALGISEGGSGIPLDREKYEASVKYWEEHASII